MKISESLNNESNNHTKKRVGKMTCKQYIWLDIKTRDKKNCTHCTVVYKFVSHRDVKHNKYILDLENNIL